MTDDQICLFGFLVLLTIEKPSIQIEEHDAIVIVRMKGGQARAWFYTLFGAELQTWQWLSMYSIALSKKYGPLVREAAIEDGMM